MSTTLDLHLTLSADFLAVICRDKLYSSSFFPLLVSYHNGI